MKFSIKDKEYTLREKTLGDLMWLQDKFGQDLSGIFENGVIPIKNILIISYQLLEDKSDFKAIDVSDIDEDGNEINGKIGGWKLLAKNLSGDFDKLIEAFNEAMGFVKKK